MTHTGLEIVQSPPTPANSGHQKNVYSPSGNKKCDINQTPECFCFKMCCLQPWVMTFMVKVNVLHFQFADKLASFMQTVVTCWQPKQSQGSYWQHPLQPISSSNFQQPRIHYRQQPVVARSPTSLSDWGLNKVVKSGFMNLPIQLRCHIGTNTTRLGLDYMA